MNIPTKLWPKMYYGKPLPVHTSNDNSNLPWPNFMKFDTVLGLIEVWSLSIFSIFTFDVAELWDCSSQTKQTFLHMSDNNLSSFKEILCRQVLAKVQNLCIFKVFTLTKCQKIFSSPGPKVIIVRPSSSSINFHIWILSETTGPIGTKLGRNVHQKYKKQEAKGCQKGCVHIIWV